MSISSVVQLAAGQAGQAGLRDSLIRPASEFQKKEENNWKSNKNKHDHYSLFLLRVLNLILFSNVR